MVYSRFLATSYKASWLSGFCLKNNKMNFCTALNSTKSSHKPFDIVINGGGIVGNTMAAILANDVTTKDLKVAIIEQKKIKFGPDIKNSKPDFRVYAINEFSRKTYEDIGVWNKFKRLNPYTKMEIFDSLKRGRLSFNALEKIYSDYKCLGSIVEDKIMASALSELNSHKTIFLEGRKMSISKKHGAFIDIDINDHQPLKTRLIIGADGANSYVRKHFGFPYRKRDYGKTAIVCTVSHKHHSETCYQRFLKDGPIGFLPLYGNFSSIVWSTTPEKAAELLELPEIEFVNALNKSLSSEFKSSENPFSDFCSDILSSLSILFPPPSRKSGLPPHVTELVGKRVSFPLSCASVKTYFKPRVALIGFLDVFLASNLNVF